MNCFLQWESVLGIKGKEKKIFFFLSFFFFAFSRASPAAYGGFQARGPIRAVAASLR